MGRIKRTLWCRRVHNWRPARYGGGWTRDICRACDDHPDFADTPKGAARYRGGDPVARLALWTLFWATVAVVSGAVWLYLRSPQ